MEIFDHGGRARKFSLNDRLLQIYHRLPNGARSVAATLRGLHLRTRRFGPESESLVAQAREREYWTPKQWETWHENRLGFVLQRAATQVPYYRAQWAERRRHGDRSSLEYLENWWLLEKDPIRENPKAFIADDCDIRSMYQEHTSGTTGKSLSLWFGKDAVRFWNALLEARCRQWYGVTRKDRWAILGGQLVTPVHQRRPPFWVWNAALNQLYMSSYHLASDLIPSYLDALQRYRITYLLGYTSALYELAQEVLRSKQGNLKMTVVVANAEPVFDYQRKALEEAFQCPVRETYGMSEIVAGASECEAGSLHLWPDAGWIEVVEGTKLVERGKPGELICTGLINVDMPLIRYRIGDRAVQPASEISCDCRRTLPVLDSIVGRTDDVLYTPDGRRIGRLDPVFKAHLPIREAQIIQEALDQVRVRYVPGPGFTPDQGLTIVSRLRDRMGDIKVVLECVDEVPRGPNGKFRSVICSLPVDQRQFIQNDNRN